MRKQWKPTSGVFHLPDNHHHDDDGKISSHFHFDNHFQHNNNNKKTLSLSEFSDSKMPEHSDAGSHYRLVKIGPKKNFAVSAMSFNTVTRIEKKSFNTHAKAYRTALLNYQHNFARLKHIERIWTTLSKPNRKLTPEEIYEHVEELCLKDPHSLVVLFHFFLEQKNYRFALDLYHAHRERFITPEMETLYKEILLQKEEELLDLISHEDPESREKIQIPVPRTLKTHDVFGPKENCANLNDFGIGEKDVIMIDGKDKEAYEHAFETVNACNAVGISLKLTHNPVSNNKAKVCILQIATPRQIILFDYFPLRKSTELDFGPKLQNFFQNHDIAKVSYDFNDEYEYLIEDRFGKMHCQEINSFVDLHGNAEVPKTETFRELLKKEMDLDFDRKEAISNWENRPLRKAQLHYAGIEPFLYGLLYKQYFPNAVKVDKHPEPKAPKQVAT